MSTVGFGGGLNELSGIGILFTVGLINFGVSVGAYALTYTVGFIFKNPIIRISKMAKRISGLKNLYIVCSYGRMGKNICNELDKQHQKFVVVETNRTKMESISEAGYIVMEGDCLDDNILRKANINRAKGLVAVL